MSWSLNSSLRWTNTVNLTSWNWLTLSFIPCTQRNFRLILSRLGWSSFCTPGLSISSMLLSTLCLLIELPRKLLLSDYEEASFSSSAQQFTQRLAPKTSHSSNVHAKFIPHAHAPKVLRSKYSVASSPSSRRTEQCLLWLYYSQSALTPPLLPAKLGFFTRTSTFIRTSSCK